MEGLLLQAELRLKQRLLARRYPPICPLEMNRARGRDGVGFKVDGAAWCPVQTAPEAVAGGGAR